MPVNACHAEPTNQYIRKIAHRDIHRSSVLYGREAKVSLMDHFLGQRGTAEQSGENHSDLANE